jgi:hypothetical protein
VTTDVEVGPVERGEMEPGEPDVMDVGTPE